MSYQRCNWPLQRFKGVSKYYVYHDGNKVIDYDTKYKDTCSLIELIGDIISRETQDDAFTEKIMVVLAKKMRVSHRLRDKPLTTGQLFKESERLIKKDKWTQKMLKKLSNQNYNQGKK